VQDGWCVDKELFFFWYSCPIVNHMVTHVLTICMHLLSTGHQVPCLLTYLQGNHVNHLEKICSVCGGHLVSINLSRNWEGYYAYSSRMGGKLCLLVTVRTLMLLMSRHNIPPIHSPRDLHRYGS
jgi:hypothetical protein